MSSDDFENRCSVLGTKEYWDQAYDSELKNFEGDDEDVGNVWFGRACLRRVVTALEQRYAEIEKRAEVSILDIGTGNGITLVELRKAGFKRLCGIDYSQLSVDLAQAVLEKDFGQNHGISLKCVDFLDASQLESLEGAPYDICFDKGTYDALLLNPDACPETTKKAYAANVRRLLKQPGGQLALTSCNWTEDELTSHFGNDFEKVGTVAHSTFVFGGKAGSTCSTVIFQVR